MNTLGWLIKREYWENRGGFLWTPIWVGVATLVLTLIGIITAEVLGSGVRAQTGGFKWSMLATQLGAEDLAQAGVGLDVTYAMIVGLLCITLFFVVFFYLLGALYDDRRDRSVLFWKSLPVSDSNTVLAKVLAAVLLAPLLAFAIATLIYLLLLVLICIWASVHGVNPLPVIAASNPFGLFWRILLLIPVSALWALPCVGWLLLCSAWARSKPFLWAVLIPIVAVIANAWLGMLGLPNLSSALLLKHGVARILLGIFPGTSLGEGLMLSSPDSANPELLIHQLNPAVILHSLGTVEMWAGVVVGIALIALAVRIRRQRIETST